MMALSRWGTVFIDFQGIFYTGDDYTSRGFHIIEGYKLNEKTGELDIYFDNQYIEQLRQTNFFKLINFNEYKQLTSPVSARLYEILIKNFKGRATALLSYCSIKDGICTYRYDSFVREQLYNPTIYARISLLIQNKFKSKHSLALYELCIDYLGAKREEAETPFLELNKFKKLMGLKETEYPDFEKLNLWVIKVAIAEINTVSDITLRTEYQKVCRKVIGVKFHITLKMGKYINTDLQLPLMSNLPSPESKLIEAPKIKKSEHIENLSTEQKKVFKQLSDIGINKLVIQNLIKTHPLENIKKQIEWLEYREPKDPAALLIRAIKQEWEMPKEIKKAEDEKNEKIKIEKMVQLAENANYIIFPDGKRYKMLSVLQDNGFIEILKNDKKVMVRPQIASKCSFA